MGEKIIRKGRDLFVRRANGIYLVARLDEYGEPRRLREPRLVKRLKQRESYASSGWGSSSSGSSWGDGSGGGLWDTDTSSDSLWNDDVNIGQDDMFSGGDGHTDIDLFADEKKKETVDLFSTDGKSAVEQTEQQDNKTYHPYKFNMDIHKPSETLIDKVITPWSIKLKEDNAEKLVIFKSEEIYIMEEDITNLIIENLLGKAVIAPKEIPERFNMFLYHLANEYLVNIAFSDFNNFIIDYKNLKKMKLEDADIEAIEKIDSVFETMFDKEEYKVGDRISVLIEKKVLLSNTEPAVVETESFDTMAYVNIPNESYIHQMSKECGGINYIKVKDRTFILRDNKIRILHIEE